jgi:predicted MFS family arabinose efflux permease
LSSGISEFQPWASFGSRQRWAFLIILFLIAIASYADRQLLPVVLEQIRIEYDLSDRMMGALGGAPFALCYAASCIPFARAADGGKRKFWLVLAFVLWTAMTILCGFATSLVLLFIARMGVGIGEGGSIPVTHALVADYFPPDSRGKAFAVLSSASIIGGSVALIAGGWLANEYGWRMAFIVIGGASLPIGLLSALILREPPKPERKQGQRMSFMRDMSALKQKRSFMLLVFGFTIYSMVIYGPLTFVPAYLMRTMGLSVAAAGAAYGIASGIGTIIGSIAGGILLDRLVKRDPRWLAWWPAGSYALAAPVAWLAFSATTLNAFLIWIVVLMVIIFTALPAIFAAIQYVCGPNRRATASAILMASINAIGLTLGPLCTGIISDALAAAYAPFNLRYAMLVMSILFLPASILLALASRRLLADAE